MPISATLTGCVVTHPEKWTASWARPASRRPQRKIRTVCAAIVRATLFTFLGSKALNTGLIRVLRFVFGNAGGKVINQLLPICIDGFSSIVIVAVQLVLSQLAPACGLIGRDFTDLNALVFSELIHSTVNCLIQSKEITLGCQGDFLVENLARLFVKPFPHRLTDRGQHHSEPPHITR